jgi:hypothetical protein
MIFARRVLNFSSRSNMLILIIITVITLVLETIIARLYTFFSSGPEALQLNLLLFAAGIFIFSGVHVLIFLDVKKRIDALSLSQSKRLRLTFFSATIIQSILSLLLFVVLFQTLLAKSYSTNLIITTVCISYLAGMVNLSILLERFIRWFVNIRRFIPLVFTLSTFGIIINTVFTLIFVVNVLSTQPANIAWHQGSMIPNFFGLNSIFEKMYSASYIISYLLAWLASITVLHNYESRLGKKFWFLIFLPLLYLLGELQPMILPLFDEVRSQDPSTFIIIYTMFFSLAKLTGAIFFGIGLWAIGKRINNESLKSFLSISGYGLILVFVSNQAILLLGYLFPPLGLTTACFLGLASFLLLAGTYSAALYVANDKDIRKSIRRSVEQEFKLLDNIGEAEMHIAIRKKVFSKMKDLTLKLKEETGIESSLTLDEIKDYTTLAIEEVKRNKMLKS